MKRYSIILLAMLMLVGCNKRKSHSLSHSLASGVLRANGVLNVVVKSDVQGTIDAVAGENPHVSVSFDEANTVVIGQTQITIRGTLWGEVPETTKKVRIEFHNNEFQIELDPKQ
jgi:hypothetical protein